MHGNFFEDGPAHIAGHIFSRSYDGKMEQGSRYLWTHTYYMEGKRLNKYEWYKYIEALQTELTTILACKDLAKIVLDYTIYT